MRTSQYDRVWRLARLAGSWRAASAVGQCLELELALRSNTAVAVERISIDVTNRCSKACPFCYNRSSPEGQSVWQANELIRFVLDCASHGVKAVSFGGGEPLEYPALLDVLGATRGALFRSITTNGLLLTRARFEDLQRVGLEKLHISIHYPEDAAEVKRAIEAVRHCEAAGIRAGVNLLVRNSQLDAAIRAAEALRAQKIGQDRIIYIPMRPADTPTPRELWQVAGGRPFQSAACLTGCSPRPRFCSIAADGSVGHCSYTSSRRRLVELTYSGLINALDGLAVTPCGASA